MVKFNTGSCRTSRHKINARYWSDQYFPSKIMCFFQIPDNETIYAIVHSTTTNNHDKDSILFERWQLEMSIHVERNGKRTINPIFHVVDVDCFGDPILVIEDYNGIELNEADRESTITVVIPFTKGWPSKFMSSYRR